MDANQRAQVIIHGRVQGVFFRIETQKVARQFGAVGWVRNLPDGNVEAVIEGPAKAVEALLAWCHKGPGLARVDTVDISWKPYAGEFDSFDVAY
jgi:acylphosphatase